MSQNAIEDGEEEVIEEHGRYFAFL